MLIKRFFLITSLSAVLFTTMSVACKKGKGTVPEPEEPVPQEEKFAKGADVSWITQMEAEGKKFYTAGGQEVEGMSLLKSKGMNTIRLRVWVNPANGWNNTADVLAKAIRAKNLGMRVMIDFHYSDSWADPGQQYKPAAWALLDLPSLKAALTQHTKTVLQALKDKAVTPEWVAVGNETNDGMLWPDGRASTNMPVFSQLVNAGYDAVKEIFPSAKVIVHTSNGYDNGLFRWMYDGLTNNGAKFDVIGMSLYPSPADWSAKTSQCLSNMTDMISRYNKEVMIVEVGMSWDQPAVSKEFLSDIMAKVKSLPGQKGLGVLYWEPLAYNNWQGYTLGALDNSGKPTVALDAFTQVP